MKTATLRFDLVMSAAALLLLVMAGDGVLSRAEDMILIIGAVLYAGWIVVWTRRESQAVQDEYDHQLGRSCGVTNAAGGRGETSRCWLPESWGSSWVPICGSTARPRSRRPSGVSDAVIGLTIVAVGTSAPELGPRWSPPVKDDRDRRRKLPGQQRRQHSADPGVTAVMAPVGAVVEPDLARVDSPVMVAATVVGIPLFITSRRVSRLEGGAFVTPYLAYLTSLLLTRGVQRHKCRFWKALREVFPNIR